MISLSAAFYYVLAWSCFAGARHELIAPDNMPLGNGSYAHSHAMSHVQHCLPGISWSCPESLLNLLSHGEHSPDLEIYKSA